MKFQIAVVLMLVVVALGAEQKTEERGRDKRGALLAYDYYNPYYSAPYAYSPYYQYSSTYVQPYTSAAYVSAPYTAPYAAAYTLYK